MSSFNFVLTEETPEIKETVNLFYALLLANNHVTICPARLIVFRQSLLSNMVNMFKCNWTPSRPIFAQYSRRTYFNNLPFYFISAALVAGILSRDIYLAIGDHADVFMDVNPGCVGYTRQSQSHLFVTIWPYKNNGDCAAS